MPGSDCYIFRDLVIVVKLCKDMTEKTWQNTGFQSRNEVTKFIFWIITSFSLHICLAVQPFSDMSYITLMCFTATPDSQGAVDPFFLPSLNFSSGQYEKDRILEEFCIKSEGLTLAFNSIHFVLCHFKWLQFSCRFITWVPSQSFGIDCCVLEKH